MPIPSPHLKGGGSLGTFRVDIVGAEKFSADEEVPEGATEFHLTERFPG